MSKFSAIVTTENFQQFFNHVLNTGEFHNQLKYADVTPAFFKKLFLIKKIKSQSVLCFTF